MTLMYNYIDVCPPKLLRLIVDVWDFDDGELSRLLDTFGVLKQASTFLLWES